MGYSHRIHVAPRFDADAFRRVASDFHGMLEPLEHLGVRIAGWDGRGRAVITHKRIRFNGPADCGHTKRELGVSYPADGARGVANNGARSIDDDMIAGWSAFGANLKARACGGDCSHETFDLMREYVPYVSHERVLIANTREGMYSESTKTAFRPYDLAVQVCLVIAKRHLGDGILITSSGADERWDEARQLCRHFLGYGEGFRLDPSPHG